jgi:hypothetical protein
MDSERAIFTQTEADRFVPIKHVDIRSRWADDHLQGGAIIGLAALALESRFGLPDFAPARLTVDLFKSARTIPTTTRTELVREGVHHRTRRNRGGAGRAGSVPPQRAATR